MATTQEEAADAALDTILLNEMSICTTVKVYYQSPSNNNNNNNTPSKRKSITLFLSHDTTHSDLKTILQKRFEIPEYDQRLSIKGKPFLHGTLLDVVDDSQAKSSCVAIDMDHFPTDPRLLSLFDNVQMGDWKERDEIMSRMMLDRPPKQCYQHLPLQVIEPSDNARLKYQCSKCHISFQNRTTRGGRNPILQKAHTCHNDDCSFCLCTDCFNNDSGHKASLDPYMTLQDLALSLGRQMASVGAWFGGRRHMCGHPQLVCESEIAPRRLCYPTIGGRDKQSFRMHRPTKILADGTRLVIRFSNQDRSYLTECGLKEAILETEMEMVCNEGCTIEEMMRYRDAWKDHANGVCFKALAKKEMEMPLVCKDGDIYTTTKLQSFTLDEAEYVVKVCVSDGDY